MKKIALGFLLAVVVGAVAVYFLKPELAYDAVPSLFAGSHKKAITQQTNLLVEQLRTEKIDAALDLTDPQFLKDHGRNGAKLHLAPRSIILRVAKIGPEDVRIDDIAVAPDGRSATAKMSLRVAGQWKPIDAVKWVRREGVWYVTF